MDSWNDLAGQVAIFAALTGMWLDLRRNFRSKGECDLIHNRKGDGKMKKIVTALGILMFLGALVLAPALAWASAETVRGTLHNVFGPLVGFAVGLTLGLGDRKFLSRIGLLLLCSLPLASVAYASMVSEAYQDNPTAVAALGGGLLVWLANFITRLTPTTKDDVVPEAIEKFTSLLLPPLMNFFIPNRKKN